MIDESGHEYPVNYAFYASYLYRWGLERAETYVKEFEKAVKSAKAAEEYNLRDSALFGRLLQFEIAWNGTVSAILSEGAFFSLAHILEADADLGCSLDLAQSGYFKHALQVLRSFLEDLFIQLVFCNRQEDFQKWEAGDYRIPRFRGKKGILKELVTDGLLTESLAAAAGTLYGDLNAAIHGAQKHLLYAGISEGRREGPIFNVERFERWCSYFSRCVDVGLRALHEHLRFWYDRKPPDTGFCSTCHRRDSFQYQQRRIAGRLLVRRTCTQCGTRLDFLPETDEKQGFYEVQIKRPNQQE